jgi:hypothetical protein
MIDNERGDFLIPNILQKQTRAIDARLTMTRLSCHNCRSSNHHLPDLRQGVDILRWIGLQKNQISEVE